VSNRNRIEIGRVVEGREGRGKEIGAQGTPIPRAVRSAITKESVKQLKNRLGIRARTRATPGVSGKDKERERGREIGGLQVEFGALGYRGGTLPPMARWSEGPWIPAQIGCGYLEGN